MRNTISLLVALTSCAAPLACTGSTDAAAEAKDHPGSPSGAELDSTAPAMGSRALKLLVDQSRLTGEQLAELEAAAPGLRLVAVSGGDISALLLAEIPDAAVLFTSRLTREMVQAGRRLEWIQLYAAGMDGALFPELIESEIILTTGKIIQGPEIADHAFALLLSLTRRLNEIIPRRRNEEWKVSHYRKPENQPIELNGRTALVIGLGGIGMQIAQRAHAFGMKVIATDPKDIPYVFFVEAAYRPDQLHDLLPRADVVFLAAPETPETRGLIGERELRLFKQGAYLIAVSRGGTFDGDALAAAIEEGRLAGAGLDVTDPEPLPKGHRLWKLENVVITPHMAGQSDRVWDRRFALLRENLRRFAAGLSLLNVADKAKGY